MTFETPQGEIDELRLQLREAQETIRAIRSGAVDAVVVDAPGGHQVYTLESADRPYRLLVEQMQQGAATLQTDGTIVYCNLHLARLLRIEHQKLIGAKFHDFVDDTERPGDDNRLQSGQSRSGGWEVEMCLRRTDGELVPAYVTYNMLPEDCGATMGVVVTDLTAQRHHEKLTAALNDLRESEERFRSLVGVITDVPWVTNKDGAFVTPQPAWEAYTGQPWEEHSGFGWANALHPEDRDRVKGIWLRACATQTLYESQGRAWHAPTQQWRHYIARATPLFERDGSVREWVGACTDIEELTQTEEALRRSNEGLESRVEERTSELVASQGRLRALAADLNLAEQRERQRLAVDLHDYLAQLLALTKIKLTQAKQQSMASPIAQALTDMQDIIDQALTYTRTLVAQLSPPALKQFGLPMALKWLAEQMQQRNLTVSLELESESLPLPEEQAMLLFQSIRELLMNVAKHAETNEVRIAVMQVDGTLHITVSDRGAGFDPAAADDRSRSAPGFGLFSIRERMLALGGRFELESRPGEGTTATLVLPLAPQTAGVANAELGMLNDELAKASEISPQQYTTVPQETSKSTSEHSEFIIQNSASLGHPKVRVLLAADHTMVRQGLRSILDAYQDIAVIGEAADGEEAVELARLLSPDVVVMDVNMPKVDGIEAIRRIKAQQPATLIVGLSLSKSNQVEPHLLQVGASHFVSKDSAAERLYEAIMAAVKGEPREH